MEPLEHDAAEPANPEYDLKGPLADRSSNNSIHDAATEWFDDDNRKETQVMDFVLSDNHISAEMSAWMSSQGSASFSRPRSSSLPVGSADITSKAKSLSFIDPFEPWDDSMLYDGHYTVIPVDVASILEMDVEKLRVGIRRAKMTDLPATSRYVEEQLSDQASSTRSSSPWESETSSSVTPKIDAPDIVWSNPDSNTRRLDDQPDARIVPLNGRSISRLPARSGLDEIVVDRFEKPLDHFRELDELRRLIYESSLFKRYIDGTEHRPFDSRIIFDVPFNENASFELIKWAKILAFCAEVTNAANEQAIVPPGGAERPHEVAKGMYDRVLNQLKHLIECRNIISRVWENIKLLKTAEYCAEFISMLVLDRKRHDVARLVRIQCSTIEKLTGEFEYCLCQTVYDQVNRLLAGNVMTYAMDLSTTCRELLVDVGLEFQGFFMEGLWRCTVHLLDMAVLSYAGTHTQNLGGEGVTAVVLPGPFFECQYYTFRPRKFSCLSEFLGGSYAWVLEDFGGWRSQEIVHVQDHLPPLFLSADAVTFGDIWGPMWKRCMVGNEGDIISYDVGGGTIVPWNLPALNAVKLEKGEFYCHWMAKDAEHENEGRAISKTFSESDVLLIGAPIQLRSNDKCQVRSDEVRQQLRNSGSISHVGAAKARWEHETRTVTTAVNAAYLSFGLQHAWKLKEGRSMNSAFIETWMNYPKSRSARSLELRLGLEVSTCTYNARRIRIIEIFQTNTMINYLRESSLQWKNDHQKARFFRALLDDNHKAFRKLWDDEKSWRCELGDAISCGLNMLQHTGKTKDGGLRLFWVPERDQPGVCVTLREDNITWIGFFEDTISSGVMAVLGSKCLELPAMTKASRDIFSRFQNKPLLQTDIHLNERCVPNSLRGTYREGRTTKSGYKGSWPIENVEVGDVFSFGARGHLETVARIGGGPRKDQIVAVWRPANGLKDILGGMHQTIREAAHNIPGIGKHIDKPSPRAQHHEVGQDSSKRESDAEPVHFHIVSTKSRTLPRSHCPSILGTYHGSSSAIETIRTYKPATPRNIEIDPKLKQAEALIIGEKNVLRQLQ